MKAGIKSPIRGGVHSQSSVVQALTYIPGAKFDGTHDHLQTSESYSIQSSLLLARLSVKIDSGDGVARMIVSALSNTILIGLNSSNKIQVNVSEDPDLGPILTAESASTYLAGPSWINILIAINTNAPAGSKIVHLYVNDVDDLGVVVDDDSAFEIGNPIKFNIGSYDFDAGKFPGGMAGLWFGFGQYLDISNTNNRRKFIDVMGKPVVNLGNNGQNPTGISPTLYLNNSYDTFHINKSYVSIMRLFGALVADNSPND